jgi:endonuclease YncB( thermonuclease family)
MIRFILLMVPLIALAHPQHGNHLYVDRIVSVYDADTFRVEIRDWPEFVGESLPIRAKGFDAPEIRGKCPDEKSKALAAKKITSDALYAAEVVELRDIERGKYFRVLADVYIDGVSLAEMHFKSKTARPYSGGTRKGWCD